VNDHHARKTVLLTYYLYFCLEEGILREGAIGNTAGWICLNVWDRKEKLKKDPTRRGDPSMIYRNRGGKEKE